MKFHHCLFKLLWKNLNVADLELQRAITLKELAHSPYFSIINVHPVDINKSAKFYEILSFPFQDIEKPKRCGWTEERMDNVKTVYMPPPPPHTHKHSLQGYKYT